MVVNTIKRDDPELIKLSTKFMTLTPEIYKSLPPREQNLLEGMFQLSLGRVFGNTSKGSFFKIWPTIATYANDVDEQAASGVEFRPLRRSDYGYSTCGLTQFSWSLWALQTITTFTVDAREALSLLVGAMLLNDYVITELDPDLYFHSIGASFVHNVQFGYLIYNYMCRNKTSNLIKLALAGEAFGDAWCVFDEMRKDVDPGAIYSHRSHALGIVTGLISGTVLSRVFKS